MMWIRLCNQQTGLKRPCFRHMHTKKRVQNNMMVKALLLFLGNQRRRQLRFLWIRVRGQTNMGDIVNVYYRPPYQEDDVGKAFFRELEENFISRPWFLGGT